MRRLCIGILLAGFLVSLAMTAPSLVVSPSSGKAGTGFSTSFQVPGGTPPGTYTVQAIGPRDAASTTFTVVTQAGCRLFHESHLRHGQGTPHRVFH